MLMAAFLLSATALATACDLSCALASSHDKCHSGQNATQHSTSTQMVMDGTMAGMDMPGMGVTDSANSSLTSGTSLGKLAHARLAEMGMCESHSCEQLQAANVSKSFSIAKQFTTTSAPGASLEIEGLSSAIHHVREDARLHPKISGPAIVSLRI
jgi:hypothetical protein